NTDGVFTAGVVLGDLAFIPFAALVLAFPSGRLARKADRVLVAVTAIVVAVAPLAIALVDKRPESGCDAPDCPTSNLGVYDSHRLARIIDGIFTAVALALIAVVVLFLWHRWRTASTALRRVL